MTVDVALKVIPKKKVKGNESSVWSEMEVLKGLSHPNVVSPRRYPCFSHLRCTLAPSRVASFHAAGVCPTTFRHRVAHMTSRPRRRPTLLVARSNLSSCVSELRPIELVPHTDAVYSS